MTVLQTAQKRGEAIGLEIGKIEGEYSKSIAIAKSLLSMNISINDISKATGLSTSKISFLAEE